MKRLEKLIESQASPIRLSEKEAEELTLLGRRLASEKEWWGSEEVGRSEDKTVIVCRKLPGERWTVLVREAVGMIGIGDLQISVRPKIPVDHFNFLASRSSWIPRSTSQVSLADPATDFADLVVRWFLSASETLLRAELSRGYSELRDVLDSVRGQLQPLDTARRYYSGQPVAVCQFEDFNEDIPLNRVIKAAAEVVASSIWVPVDLRKRAKAILARTHTVGPLMPADMHVTIDRLTYRYRDALAFAKYVISRAGLRIAHGNRPSWSFLIRTPELIEEGVREVLKAGLPQAWKLRKQRMQLQGSPLTLNPDIVVNGGQFVADVKYKLASSEWIRSDLYQVVTFAEGLGSRAAALIYFDVGSTSQTAVTVGTMRVSRLRWDAASSVSPDDAARRFIADFAAQLEDSVPARELVDDRVTALRGLVGPYFGRST